MNGSLGAATFTPKAPVWSGISSPPASFIVYAAW